MTGPVLADVYEAKDRGKGIAIANLLPYLGPALGPIVGGIAAQHLHWQWLFWILSIFDAIVIVIGYFVIKESYHQIILERKAAAFAKAKNPSLKKGKQRLSFDGFHEFWRRLRTGLALPIKLLLFRPIVQLIALAAAIEFGIYSLVLSTFAELFITHYHQSQTTASLHYISIALGAACSAQIGNRLMDKIWHYMSTVRHPEKEPIPEYRIPYMIPGLMLGIPGILIYGWAAQYTIHWIVVDIGAMLFTCGSFMFTQALLAYLIDEFTQKHAASAGASSRLATYLFAFFFPIFAPQLYEKLGYGWGASLLGFIFAALAIPAVAIFWWFGERIRALGRD